MEPRARASRHKGSLNFGTELEQMLDAFGAPLHPDFSQRSAISQHHHHRADPARNRPYPETVRVLDEILTDFVIETCHDAVTIAAYSGRAKLKLADFEWAVRKDKWKLGHVHGMMQKKREIDTKKKAFDVMDTGAGDGARLGVDEMQLLGGAVGEEGTGKGKGRGRGRRKKRKGVDVDDGGAAQADAEAEQARMLGLPTRGVDRIDPVDEVGNDGDDDDELFGDDLEDQDDGLRSKRVKSEFSDG